MPYPAAYTLPGLLPGARGHQVVDDVRRDQDEEVAPDLTLLGKAEQFAQNGQVYKERDSGLGYRDLGHREPANHGRFAVRDEDLVVRLLRLEREADVHRRRLDRRTLGVQLHQDLPVGGDMGRHGQLDARLLELHRGARHRVAGTGRRAGVDDADRHAVADEDLGRPGSERQDRVLELDVG